MYVKDCEKNKERPRCVLKTNWALTLGHTLKTAQSSVICSFQCWVCSYTIIQDLKNKKKKTLLSVCFNSELYLFDSVETLPTLLACVLNCFHCIWLFVTPGAVIHQALRNSPGKNAGMGYHALLQGIFPTQRSKPCLLCILHCQAGSLPLASPGKPTQHYPNVTEVGKMRTMLLEDSSHHL